VLVAPRNPLNIGAAARAMSNFGFFHLRVVNAYDVAYAEARSAVNASEVLIQSQQYPTVADAVADCTLVVGTTSADHRQLDHSLRRLETAAPVLHEALEGGPVALLFGSEKFGLSNEDLSHCHWLTRIPSREEHGSMNLGQAVAICLYELIRSEPDAHREPARKRLAEAADLERVDALLVEALRISGFINEVTGESAEQKLRRMVLRLGLDADDARLWQGMLRQILWKLRQSGR
jgi:tRNA/rRNA methyltransferase